MDPTKKSATDNDFKVIYRVQWQNNYLRYLVVFKNGNNNEENSNLEELGRSLDDNNIADEVSAFNVFELEIERLNGAN